MKEIREEAERHRKAKLEKYGAEHHRAHGGHVHKVTCETGPEIKRAHGGKVKHSDEREDEALLHRDLKPSAFKHHRANGGPIAGRLGGPKLGRGRKGSKGTNVNIAVGRPGGDGAPVGLPPALGAGPAPTPMPPRPMPPIAAGPRPMPPPGGAPAGPMKHGGKIHHEKHGHLKHKHHGHSGHRQ